MLIGARIAELLKDRGLSQAELARRVGVTQPTIYGLIHKNKTGSAHLHRIARELGTTSAYLAGETDDQHSDVPTAPNLTTEELDWIELLRGLAPKDRAAVTTLTRSLATSAQSPMLQAHPRPFRGEASPAHEARLAV